MRTRYHYLDGALERIELVFDDARRSGDPAGLITPALGVRFPPRLPEIHQQAPLPCVGDATGPPVAVAPASPQTPEWQAPFFTAPAIFTPDVNMGETVNVPEEPHADPLIPPVPPDDSAVGGITASVSAPSRLKAANIRGMWAGVFGGIASAGSEGITYALNNLTTLEIPQGLLLLVGVGLTSALTGSQYWAKKLAKPEGTW